MKKRCNRSYRESREKTTYFYSVAGRYAFKRESAKAEGAKQNNLFAKVRGIMEGLKDGE